MYVQSEESFCILHIPDDDHVVKPTRGQYIGGNRVPLHLANLTLVFSQFLYQQQASIITRKMTNTWKRKPSQPSQGLMSAPHQEYATTSQDSPLNMRQ